MVIKSLTFYSPPRKGLGPEGEGRHVGTGAMADRAMHASVARLQVPGPGVRTVAQTSHSDSAGSLNPTHVAPPRQGSWPQGEFMWWRGHLGWGPWQGQASGLLTSWTQYPNVPVSNKKQRPCCWDRNVSMASAQLPMCASAWTSWWGIIPSSTHP